MLLNLFLADLQPGIWTYGKEWKKFPGEYRYKGYWFENFSLKVVFNINIKILYHFTLGD